MKMQDIDIREAVQVYALANTPLYLIRKLKEDANIQSLSRQFSGEELLTALEGSLRKNPQTLEDYVRPYSYLVALALLPKDTYLRDAAKLPNAAKWEWYPYVQSVLMETFTPTQRLTIQAKPRIGSLGLGTTTPTKREVIILEKPGGSR